MGGDLVLCSARVLHERGGVGKEGDDRQVSVAARGVGDFDAGFRGGDRVLAVFSADSTERDGREGDPGVLCLGVFFER